MDDAKTLNLNYNRLFGVEIELNSLDGRDFEKFPLANGELPLGIDYLGHLLVKNLKSPVKIKTWHHTHNNLNYWICKPDRSCGIELCSPICNGNDINKVEKVISLLGSDPKVMIDKRCSFHVHINVEDCLCKNTLFGHLDWSLDKSELLAAILAWWVKCEPVFLDSVGESRKRSRHAMCIGCTDMFTSSEKVSVFKVNTKLSRCKYFTCNCFHLGKGRRPTVEFRIIGNKGCTNPRLAKNWIRLLVHFVDMAKLRGLPENYLWLDPKAVFSFLGFTGEFKLCRELEEARNWFLASIISNIEANLPGVWSQPARAFAKMQAEELFSELRLDRGDIDKYLTQ